MISARRANLRGIRRCWTGWPASSWTVVGTSSTWSASWLTATPIDKGRSLRRKPGPCDPDNREFSAQGRWRLDAELVRDNALAISGLLAPRIGGPSVMPYQPEGYWENLNFPTRNWEPSAGEACIAAAFTPGGSAPTSIPAWSRSMRPRARNAVPSAIGPTFLNRPWCCSTTRLTSRRRAPLRLAS